MQNSLIIGIFMAVGFLDKLKHKWSEGKFVCVGLDSPDFSLLKKVVDDTYNLVCAYKINSAFFEAEGSSGWKTLEEIINHLKQTCPDIPIILDAKRADIGNTNSMYAKSAFDKLGVDALTVNPYPGKTALQPFLDYKDKGIFVWLGASNVSEDKLQDLPVGLKSEPLFQFLARQIVDSWNRNGNCALVWGATIPEQLKKVREIVKDMPILVPGVGAQGGDLESSLKNGLDSNKQGLIINSSRDIILASNPKGACQKLHNQIQEILKNV